MRSILYQTYVQAFVNVREVLKEEVNGAILTSVEFQLEDAVYRSVRWEVGTLVRVVVAGGSFGVVL